MREGIPVVVSGFSGAGKGAITKRLASDYDSYVLSVSATTRKPREGEVCGREYFFVDVPEFEKMIAQGELIEYARYVEHYYGTPKAYVSDMLRAGKDVILEIDIQGAMKVKASFPEAVLIFVTTPDVATLKERLTGRGTESREVINSRMMRAAAEAEGMDAYDYLIINDDLDEAVRDAHLAVCAEHLRMSRHAKFAERITRELQKYARGEKSI